jgi:hypothetical protein
MSARPIKVLYIAGAGRSGSTVLARLLGQQPRWFDGGEIFRFPENILNERVCGCGAPFRQCAVWPQILQEALGGFDNLDAHALSWRAQPIKNSDYLVRPRSSLDKKVQDTMANYLSAIEAIYRSIVSVTDSSLIVDSSKSPIHGHFLDLTGAVDLRVVHLVRDPRAVAYSTARRRKPGQRNQSFFSTLHTWTRWNHLASRFWSGDAKTPYLLVRYEDFIKQPRKVLAAIAELVEEDASWESSFRGEREVWLNATHHISGNVGKHSTGSVRLSMDEEWRGQMSGWDRLLATAWCSPWLGRYGYPALSAFR